MRARASRASEWLEDEASAEATLRLVTGEANELAQSPAPGPPRAVPRVPRAPATITELYKGDGIIYAW